MVVETFGAEETFALGRKIGEAAVPGQVYALNGDLGVGKTVFTQGVAKGLGIEGAVSSPTFTILQIYEEGRLPFIILTFTVLAAWKRWTRLVMMSIFMETGSA